MRYNSNTEICHNLTRICNPEKKIIQNCHNLTRNLNRRRKRSKEVIRESEVVRETRQIITRGNLARSDSSTNENYGDKAFSVLDVTYLGRIAELFEDIDETRKQSAAREAALESPGNFILELPEFNSKL